MARAICRVRGCGKIVASHKRCDRHAKHWKRKHVLGFRTREQLTAQRWRERNRPRLRKIQRENGRRLRERDRGRCFAAYGGYLCYCCGETHPMFLTLDHRRGGGYKHRIATGNHLYRWIVRHHFPKGMFRVACWNCNSGRARNGGICPHQEERNGKKRHIGKRR